jgi:hypothetical protein
MLVVFYASVSFAIWFRSPCWVRWVVFWCVLAVQFVLIPGFSLVGFVLPLLLIFVVNSLLGLTMWLFGLGLYAPNSL